MALVPDSQPRADEDNKLSQLGIKVKGDLGDLQIVEKNEVSDSECSDDDEKNVDKNDKLVPEQTSSNLPLSIIQSGQIAIPSNVAINHSENIQFGNNTYFHGPVVIKQLVTKRGIDNASYTTSDHENDHISTSPSPDKSRLNETSPTKFVIPPWVKVSLSCATVFILGFICALAVYLQSHTQDDSPSDFDSNEPAQKTNYTKVVGMCYDNFQIILFTIIVVPITIMIMIYSLLTTTQNRNGVKKTYQGNGVQEQPILNYPQGGFNDSIEPTVIRDDPLLISPNHLRIVSRSDWLAQPVEKELDKLRHPAPWVIITHTATEGCYYQSQCVLRVRYIQMFHIESKEWDDIGYNFLVAGDGSAYFGRGWDYIGSHTLGYNRYSIGIAFIGTFNNKAPPKKQIEACQKLIKLGVQLGKIAKDYKLFAHRQLMSTLSPGDTLYGIIKEWPHFVKNTSNIEELIPEGY